MRTSSDMRAGDDGQHVCMTAGQSTKEVEHSSPAVNEEVSEEEGVSVERTLIGGDLNVNCEGGGKIISSRPIAIFISTSLFCRLHVSAFCKSEGNGFRL